MKEHYFERAPPLSNADVCRIKMARMLQIAIIMPNLKRSHLVSYDDDMFVLHYGMHINTNKERFRGKKDRIIRHRYEFQEF